jgi:nicotinamidase-related amidase
MRYSLDSTGSPLAITGVDESVKVISSLVDTFRKAGGPVIFIQHTAGSGAPIFNPDNDSYDMIGGLVAKAGEKVIVKQAPSSFTGTDLDATLKAAGVKQVVLTGYMAHVCVTGTARSGMSSMSFLERSN